MQIYILHPDRKALDALDFQRCDGVIKLEGNIETLDLAALTPHRIAIAAPGNSFGLMDGGYDLALVRRFGVQIQHNVQSAIAGGWLGELPVGCALSVPVQSDWGISVIYAPTMQVPMNINGTAACYYATTAALREARGIKDCGAVVLPLMGAGVGGLSLEDVSLQMSEAIRAAQMPIKAQDLTWNYAIEKHRNWHKMCHMPE